MYTINFMRNAFFNPASVLLSFCMHSASDVDSLLLITLRHFFIFTNLCPCLGPGLFMSYLCDQTHLLFCLFGRICRIFRGDDDVDEDYE